MTYPNRRQQPEQQRSDVATRDGVNRQTQAIEQRRASIARVATLVQTAARDFDRLLPEHISVATFMTSAGAALWKSEDLMQGALQSPEAFLIALRESAMLGHVPGTPNYWLTPRKEKGNPSILGIEGYEGIVDRMYRSGGVLSVHAEVVRENDTFSPYGGPNGRPLHLFNSKGGAFASRTDRGPVIGVYAYAMLPGGMPSEQVLLSMEDLMEIRAGAAAGGAIWRKHPIPMFKKSALRRLEPYVPTSFGYRQTQAQAQAFVAAAAPQAAMARMEDQVTADPEDEVVEGEVEQPQDRPVTDIPFEPERWGGPAADPSAGDDPWAGMDVASPPDQRR